MPLLSIFRDSSELRASVGFSSSSLKYLDLVFLKNKDLALLDLIQNLIQLNKIFFYLLIHLHLIYLGIIILNHIKNESGSSFELSTVIIISVELCFHLCSRMTQWNLKVVGIQFCGHIFLNSIEQRRRGKHLTRLE